MRGPKPEQHRISRLKKLMHAEGVDALLVSRREDVRYLSGFTGSAGSLLVSSGKPCLITDFRYQLQAARQTSGITLLIQRKDFFSAFHDAADQLGIGTIWFDESALTIEILKKIKKTGLKTRGHRNLVQQLRLRKDGTELAHIRTAIRRAERAFRNLRKYIKSGATEQHLGITLEHLMREEGSRKAAFDTIVASAGNGAMPHATVTNRRIRNGDLITFDFGAEAEGYFSDITRTICLGKPASGQLGIHGLVLTAQREAIKAVRPGVTCRAVDNAAREIIRKAGHGEHFGHGTGHGVGLMVHEGPSVSFLSKDIVERDMVFTVEPGIYIPGWGGVRIEDVVLVAESGAKVLTSLPRELEIVNT